MTTVARPAADADDVDDDDDDAVARAFALPGTYAIVVNLD